MISYDAPTHLKTYVHRVGRTARSGLRGVAYTLCRPAEEAPFLAMTSGGDLRKRRAPPARLALADEDMDAHRADLRVALVAVKLHLEADAKSVAAEEGERAGAPRRRESPPRRRAKTIFGVARRGSPERDETSRRAARCRERGARVLTFSIPDYGS